MLAARFFVVVLILAMGGCGDEVLYSATCEGEFSRADVNNDRVLDASERKNFTWSYLPSPNPDLDRDGLLHDMEACGSITGQFRTQDTNGDNKVDADEYYEYRLVRVACQKRDPRCLVDPKVAQADFERTDVDRSGGLDLYEFAHAAAYTPKFPPMPSATPSAVPQASPAPAVSGSPSPAASPTPKPSPTAVVGTIE